MLKIHKQNGDTIIEILIALTVLAFAMGTAFAVSNRSARTLQASRERSQAVLYANEQAERLASNFTEDSAGKNFRNSLNSFSSGTNPVCIDGINIWNTEAQCTKDALYKIYIICQPGSPLTADNNCSNNNKFNTYIIRVNWDSIVSTSQDQVEIVYGR